MTATLTEPPVLATIPPHDLDAERAALGSMFVATEITEIAIDGLQPDDFYLPLHRTLFQQLAKVYASRGSLDELLVCSDLETAGVLDGLGGRDEIGRIVAGDYTATRIEEYIQVLKIQARNRQALLLGQKLTQAALRGAGAQELESLGIETQPTPISDEMRVQELLEYDTENDAKALLGARRWLCEGGTCLWVAQSGVGKSTLCMQAAVSWALGRDLFGIQPARPLSSLIVQAENDAGDLSEQVKGTLNGLGMAGRAEELRKKIVFALQSTLTGERFAAYLERKIKKHKPDLVWIDPLLSYLGGNANEQEVVSHFLRNLLTPICQKYHCIIHVIHHTPKPLRDVKSRAALAGGDLSYLGAGSAELTNWARAVMVLREPQESVYELRAAKRGERAGLTTIDGSEAREIYLKHGSRGLFWERAQVAEDAREVCETALFDDVVAWMGGEGKKQAEITEYITKLTGCSRMTAYRRVSEMMSQKRIIKNKYSAKLEPRK